MNKKLFLLPILFALFASGSVTSQAQIIEDTLIYFKGEPTFVGSELDMARYDLAPGVSLKKVSTSEARSLGITASPRLRASSSSVILRQKGNCYQVQCVSSGCRLLWWDRNGDNKVQPKRELRCGGAGKTSCNIRVKKMPCR